MWFKTTIHFFKPRVQYIEQLFKRCQGVFMFLGVLYSGRDCSDTVCHDDVIK